MANNIGHYRERAKECCLNAVKVEDNSRRLHWLEAAGRWLTLGREAGAALTTSASATVTKRHDGVKSSRSNDR
jgi:hypothetical protein